MKIFLLLTFLTGLSAYAQLPTHPNVVLIITDDQGYGDLGFTGNLHVKTPALDQLARESIRLTNFYVSPRLRSYAFQPDDGSLLVAHGVHDTYNGGAIMAPTEVTIAEMLAARYTSGIFGKWHLGDNYPSRPGDQGFDESVIHLARGNGAGGRYS